MSLKVFFGEKTERHHDDAPPRAFVICEPLEHGA
jgi:hypothetical protein